MPAPPWLLLIHQIPPRPAYLRVKVGRRLERLGAVPVKNSVYVLPRNAQAREDFQWLRGEILAGGGDAFVCEARFVEGLADDSVEAAFNAARQADYERLTREARRLQADARAATRRGTGDGAAAALARLRARLAHLAGVDFFGAAGRAAAERALAAAGTQLRKPARGGKAARR